MEDQYFKYKQVLTEKLSALGFTTQPENNAGLGRSVAFVQDGFQLQLVFNLRDQMVILQAKKDGKSAGHATLSNIDSLKDFEIKVNGILVPQDFEIEVPTSPATTGGFLSKFFGQKSSK